MTTLGQINTAFAPDEGAPPSAGNGYMSGESNQSKSPLAKFNIFNGIATSEKKLKADGQPPKRRGPKPDSKPALTRRQELNRQAQRTHRERKEQYIKALEQEVLHLKDMVAQSTAKCSAYEAEVYRLKDILSSHGIHVNINLPTEPTSSGSYSGSYPSASDAATPPQSNQYGHGIPNSASSPVAIGMGHQNGGVDYDQVGVDFVLTLEKPCMDHMNMLCVQSQQSEGDEISGHALMVSCPTINHVNHLIERPDIPYRDHALEMKASDLLKLLDLSNRLPLTDEITPIMAWAMILRHEYQRYLTKEDIESIKQVLQSKVRCYGFGAVLEEFEVAEAMNNVLAQKPTMMTAVAY